LFLLFWFYWSFFIYLLVRVFFWGLLFYDRVVIDVLVLVWKVMFFFNGEGGGESPTLNGITQPTEVG